MGKCFVIIMIMVHGLAVRDRCPFLRVQMAFGTQMLHTCFEKMDNTGSVAENENNF